MLFFILRLDKNKSNFSKTKQHSICKALINSKYPSPMKKSGKIPKAIFF